MAVPHFPPHGCGGVGKKALMKTRGTIGVDLLLIAAAALAVGVFAGGWKPLQIFKPKPPTAELTRLQDDLTKAQAEADALRAAKLAAEQAERDKQIEQVRYAQEMLTGANESLSRQPVEHRTPQTQLASDLMKRSEFALGLAIGSLPVDKQREILRIVDQALSTVEAERQAAIEALAAKDAELRVVTSERDAVKAELPKLAAKVAAAEMKVETKQAEVVETTGKLKTWAEMKDAAERKAGSFAAQLDRIWHAILWIAGIWAFLAYVLPGLIKHLNAGPLKNVLRDVSGYATSPLLYADAKKKIPKP